MAAPRYFQTEDEKRMAAIRANPSGRPVQMVRPMRPAGSDSREKWRENAGGKMIGMDQYLENNRKMYTMENVPTAARTPAPKEQMTNEDRQMAILGKYGGAQAIQDRQRSNARQLGRSSTESDAFNDPAVSSFSPSGGRLSTEADAFDTSPVKYVRPYQEPVPKWQQDITKKYRGIGEKGTPENEAYVAEYKDRMSSKQPFDTMELADDVMGRFVPNTGLNTSGAAPAPTVQSGMSSGKMPEQRPALPPLIAKTDPFGTMLNDRPGGGRAYESFSRPMGSGTLSQRPKPTVSGASERVAYRRAIRMDPKSTEEDRRYARGIGGARNQSYGNYD